MKLRFRMLVIMALCAGVLVPVFSTADDRALLTAMVRDLAPSSPVKFSCPLRQPLSESSDLFWAQFEHMDGPTTAPGIPDAERAALICPLEPRLHSVPVSHRPGRGPPSPDRSHFEIA